MNKRKKLKLFLRYVLYNTLGNFHVRLKKADDVIVLTSSRSGSTWLIESLLETSEFKLYNQPFDTLLNKNVYAKLLPKSNPYFINLKTEDSKKIKRFWHKIISGKINPNTYWKIYSKHFNFIYKRKLIKSFFTKDLIDFYTTQSNLKIIYLTRNPLKRGASNINYGYSNYMNYLIDNDQLKHISNLNIEKINSIFNTTKSEITKQIISWYIENSVIMNYLSLTKNNILVIKYEDMVNKKEYSEKIIGKFIFKNDSFKLSNRPSKSTITKKKKELQINKLEIESILNALPNNYFYNNKELFN